MRKIFIFLLCFSTLFLCFAIPAFAEVPSPANEDTNLVNSPTPGDSIDDLTGYTVVVPYGWTASSAYGLYYLTGSFIRDGGQYEFLSLPGSSSYAANFGLGYYSDGAMSPYSNSISAHVDIHSSSPLNVQDGESFALIVTGGDDASNASLISWLVLNDAVFTPTTSSEPETSSIAGGIYHFKQFADLPDIPDASWSDGEGYSYGYTVSGRMVTTSRTIYFTNFNIKFDEYVSSSHYTVTFYVGGDSGYFDLATYSVSYGQIQLEKRPDLSYIVFDEALIGSYDDIEFIREFLVAGLPDTDTSATDNPWLYILEMIIEALKVDIFGYFSIWDIFTTICGIFIVTWLLKLLAGG